MQDDLLLFGVFVSLFTASSNHVLTRFVNPSTAVWLVEFALCCFICCVVHYGNEFLHHCSLICCELLTPAVLYWIVFFNS